MLLPKHSKGLSHVSSSPGPSTNPQTPLLYLLVSNSQFEGKKFLVVVGRPLVTPRGSEKEPDVFR